MAATRGSTGGFAGGSPVCAPPRWISVEAAGRVTGPFSMAQFQVPARPVCRADARRSRRRIGAAPLIRLRVLPAPRTGTGGRLRERTPCIRPGRRIGGSPGLRACGRVTVAAGDDIDPGGAGRAGNLVTFEGRIGSGSLDRDGESVYRTDLVATDIEVLHFARKQEEARPAAKPKAKK